MLDSDYKIEVVKFHFGIKYEYFQDDIRFGISLNFNNIMGIRLPHIVLDFYKTSFTFGWVDLNLEENSAILK